MESEATLNAGDVCLDCQQKGLDKYLRYFRINLNGDTILKCESSECMYPYHDEMCSSDDDDDDKSIDNVVQTNSLKLINDLIQQFDYVEEVQDNLMHVPDPVTQFDITFLDDLNAEDNANVCKPNLHDTVIAHKSEHLPETNSMEYGVSCKTDPNIQLPDLNSTNDDFKNYTVNIELPTNDNIKDIKPRINIQSIETVKFELPTISSKNSPITSTNETVDQHTINGKPLKVEQITNQLDENELKFKITTLNNASDTAANKRTATKSQSFDIPKADIYKEGNAVLKKFAMKMNDKTPKINRKCKKQRSKNYKEKANIARFSQPETSSSNNDSNYTFDNIAKLLLPKTNHHKQ